MTTYRVAERHGRVAVFDQYGRCIELLEPGTSDEVLAAIITTQHRAGEYAARDFVEQRTFDPDSQQWSGTFWPRTED